jgi:hypothetical protein
MEAVVQEFGLIGQSPYHSSTKSLIIIDVVALVHDAVAALGLQASSQSSDLLGKI